MQQDIELTRITGLLEKSLYFCFCLTTEAQIASEKLEYLYLNFTHGYSL